LCMLFEWLKAKPPDLALQAGVVYWI
jgi:hypothetical protein